MRSILVTPELEMLVLKRASISKGYKHLTIREAERELLRLQSRRTNRLINEEIQRISNAKDTRDAIK